MLPYSITVPILATLAKNLESIAFVNMLSSAIVELNSGLCGGDATSK